MPTRSTYATYEELEADFARGALHPGDLKAALTVAINACVGRAIEPRRARIGVAWDASLGRGGPQLSRPTPRRRTRDHRPVPRSFTRRMLEPVRRHFASGEPAKLLEQVKKYRVTR